MYVYYICICKFVFKKEQKGGGGREGSYPQKGGQGQQYSSPPPLKTD